MRIVAGELGGRRIRSPRAAFVRPTSDRVREALFSILGEVGGRRALDLFCGTGALGLEAISRGAAHATFVDLALGAVARNVRDLDVAERARLVRADAAGFLRRDEGSYDLVFCDPPYRLARRLGPAIDSAVAGRLAEGGRVIVEAGVDAPLELSLPLLDERRYGATLIRIHASEAS